MQFNIQSFLDLNDDLSFYFKGFIVVYFTSQSFILFFCAFKVFLFACSHMLAFFLASEEMSQLTFYYLTYNFIGILINFLITIWVHKTFWQTVLSTVMKDKVQHLSKYLNLKWLIAPNQYLINIALKITFTYYFL